jgi:DNA-directed RNA polymerase alpha subunit
MDYSGDVTIIQQDGLKVTVPVEALRAFVACNVRHFKIEAVKQLHNDEILDLLEQQELLTLHVAELNLPFRVQNILNRESIHLIGELLSWSPANLLALKGFGVVSLYDVQNKLWKYGLKLTGDRQ